MLLKTSAITRHAVDSSDDKKKVLTYTCLCCIVYVEEAEDSVSEYRECTCDTQGLGICVSILKNTSYMLLLVIKFLAQLVTLHSLLCFSPNLFCATSSQDKAHLA